MSTDPWGYHPASGHISGTDLTGFAVEAVDGHVGKVDKHSDEVGSAHLLVDTGVWIFGREVLLPAGAVSRIDTEERVVHVDLTKEQIKDSPEFERQTHSGDPAYYTDLATYYGMHRLI
ncbi:PRC-barrel domain containing protein [Streptomyces sp. NBC_01335]|uniref:PRC-barrel domain containing protein n=1 Tax=unclassified Streptomyces TaxID=2593676 RepID=UPI002E14A0EE|nr:PRC-barrel domain containing protein [Streptomyces sp. NBC_01335]